MSINGKYRSRYSQHQSGVVLVVSMIILSLLTLIGLVGMQTTSLEEKMAGNMRAKNLAFQAAEDALKFGEQQVVVLNNSSKTADFFNCLPGTNTDGLYTPTNEPDIEKSTENDFWSGSDVLCAEEGKKRCEPGDDKYVIQCLSEPGLYRVTARAQGNTPDSVVILQSVFSLKPDTP